MAIAVMVSWTIAWSVVGSPLAPWLVSAVLSLAAGLALLWVTRK